MPPAVKAYSGKKPYIFLSYSHKDTDRAHPLIADLQKRGFNVWFDEGIHSGAQWKRIILEHINNCAVLLFLVTQNSLDSAECEKEIYFAAEKKKKFINVVMGAPQLPDWFIFDFKLYQYVDEANFPSYDLMLDKVEEDLIYIGLEPEFEKPEIHESTRVSKSDASPWVCKNCGSNNSGDDDVCEVCGASERYVAPPTVKDPPPPRATMFTSTSLKPFGPITTSSSTTTTSSASTSTSARSTSTRSTSTRSTSTSPFTGGSTAGSSGFSSTASSSVTSYAYTRGPVTTEGGIKLGAGTTDPYVSVTLSAVPHVKKGKSILFGSYPQKHVTNTTIIAQLNTGLIPFNSAAKIGPMKIWTAFEYYLESVRKDFMFYTDKILDGKKYRGIYFTEPRYTSEKAGDSSHAYQSMRGYKPKSIYWFEYSPIKWNILETKDGYTTLVADEIIDSQKFYFHDGLALCNYQQSDIRFWLNDHFYHTAFSAEEKRAIVLDTVDNGAHSTTHERNPNVCADTKDRVFLLSLKEASIMSPAERKRKPTDYALCQGTFLCNFSAPYNGNGWWWTRSPTSTTVKYIHYINYDGGISNYYPQHTHFGTVPAIKVILK